MHEYNTMRKTHLVLLSFMLLSFSAGAEEAADSRSLQITNMDKLAANLKLDSFKKAKFTTKIKIAVFDNGFYGYENDLGKLLPADTVCYSDSVISKQECKDEYAKVAADDGQAKSEAFHGLLMAEIISQILTRA